MGFFSKLFGKKQKSAPAPIETKPVVDAQPTAAPISESAPIIEPQPPVVNQPAIQEEKPQVIEPVPALPVETKPEAPESPISPTPQVEAKPEAKIPPVAVVAETKPVIEAKPVALEVAIPVEPVAPPPVEPAKPRYAGKYEVFPEAGLFKYRLKASNGEILIVSNGYTTRNGAAAGIETLKKNIESGKFELITDKNNFSQFRLYTQNGSRQIAAGEFYETMKRAESAMESVKKFAGTDKILDLEELPVAEIREEVMTLKPIEKNPNGKYEIGNYEGQWIAMLKASNGEVLFVTAGYASKSGLLNGLESIKKAVAAENFRVSKDKQGRFQFKLYSPINQLILVGETYGSKEACFSSVDSVRRFAQDAKLIE